MNKTILTLIFLCTCAVVVGCATPTPPPTMAPTVPPASPTAVALKSGKLRYLQIFNLDVRSVPTLMALDLLRAQGYSVEWTGLANSTLIVDALSRGDAEVGSVNPQTAWAAIAKGAPVRTIMQGIGAPAYLVVKSDLKDCRELDGKRVGVAALTGVNPTEFNLYLKNKCANAKPQLLVIAESAGRVASLVAGELDAVVLPLDEMLDLTRRAPEKFTALVEFGKEFPDVLVGGLHVRKDWAEKNPEIVKDLIRAHLLVFRQINANPKILVDESLKRLQIDQAAASSRVDAYLALGVWNNNGGLTKENIQATLDFLAQINQVPATLQVNDIADLSYLNAVLAEIGRK